MNSLRTAVVVLGWLILLALSTVGSACSKEIDAPQPQIDPPSAAANPPPVDPEIVCRDQLASKVTLHGEHFAPIPIDLPKNPKIALPTVTLARAHELDGGNVGDPDQVIYSGDPDADRTNAADADGNLIEVDGQPLLQWKSQQEMSFLVTQDLVLGAKPAGDDTRMSGPLPAGVWDVRVQNPKGKSAESLGSLAVVEKPELATLSPGVVCLDQGPRTVALTGQTLLRNGSDQVQLAAFGVDERFALDLADCTAIAHDGLDAEVCKSAKATLAKGSIPAGYPALTLENPETAACKSEDEISLRVVPAPHIDRVVEALACVAQGARMFVIEGRDFLRIDGKRVPTVTVGDQMFAVEDMDCASALPAGEHMVEPCSSITISVKPGEFDAGLYSVGVINPDNLDYPDNGDPQGCSFTASDALRIVPPPSIDAVEPSYVCLDDGGREVSVHGSDFLVVDGKVPSVEVDGSALLPSAIEASDCDSAGLDVGSLKVERCSTLVLSLAKNDVDPGNPVLKITNPMPAGCNDEAMDVWTVLPRPTLELAQPQPICNQQGDDAITLTGTGFLALASNVPQVTFGGVAATSVAVTDASCTAIAGRTDARLCTELVATVAAGSLAAGVHDVVVVNTDPAGCTTDDAITLAVVDAPTVATVAPSPVCLEQGAVSLTITGTGFVRTGTALPAVAIGGVTASDVMLTEATCSAVPGTPDSVACTELKVTLPMDALAADTSNRVTITNPGSADCASQEAIDLQVVPPPAIASIDSANVCTGGGAVTITGTNLAGVTARLIDPNTQGAINATSTLVNGAGTQATISFGSGVAPSTYQLVISSTSGCNATAGQTVVASLGPVLFFADPPVAYNGVSLRATLYASGVSVAPANVILSPVGGGTVADQHMLTDITWSALAATKIGATIPSGIPQGNYDVTLDFATGCDAVLAGGIAVKSDTTLALLTPALSPQFGEQNTAVAVDVAAKATADLGAGEVNFVATPRAYLSSSALSTAEPLRAVAFDTEERLSAVVPDTLPTGTYDLVVINPDGAVGFQAGAYKATAVAPPAIDSVTPTQLDNDIARPITIAGANFFNPTTEIQVDLDCLSPGATTPTTTSALAIDGASTVTSLIATVPSGITHGSVCVVRVTNTSNDTFDEYSAITVTNPASKLPEFQSGTALVDGRRAPASAIGHATRRARFVYAIGGDDGTSANAKQTVEAATIRRFGDLGTWRTLTTQLPVGVTEAQAVAGGRYLYLFGGLVADATTTTIRRASVLDPSAAPEVNAVDLRFFATPDSDPATRDGLAPGAWSYVVSAVFTAGDTDNPSGESLPSEPITLYAPDVPDGVEVQLGWPAVFGADGTTEAASYRIYRTMSPNAPLSTLRLLAQVTSPTHTFVDQNPASLLDANKLPLASGDLGEWRTMPATLNTARAAYGLALANDTNCDPFLYIVGGRAAAATESASYEYASFDAITGALGAFTEATGTSLTARRELAAFVADDQTSTQIAPATGCESYLYASHGRTGASGFVTTLQEAAVQAGGALGSFTSSGPSPRSVAGHAAFFSSDGAYVLGGASNSAEATNTAVQANMCSGTGCTAPDLQNFSSASNNLLEARYLPGFTREGAFFYLIGGADANGDPLASSERNVR